MGNITSDHERFKGIIRDQIGKNLGRYISREDIVGRRGNETIRIPIPVIDIPRFRYGAKGGGVGQGVGEIGDVIDPHSSKGTGSEGSNDSDENLIDVELFMSELEEIVFKELGLPYLEPRRDNTIDAQRPAYRSIARRGVARNFRRTYQAALRRMIASGGYQPGDAVTPMPEDLRYLVSKERPDKQSNAALIYMLDVSGSMGEEQRRLCRSTNSWLQRIIRRGYDNIDERFIVHGAEAREVEGSVFYGTTQTGGTISSSAFRKAEEIIREDYPREEWNVYCFYYSDGDIYKPDIDEALSILDGMLPSINMFCYGEYNDSNRNLLKYQMEQRFRLNGSQGDAVAKRRIRTSKLFNNDSVVDTLRIFLNKDDVLYSKA